MQIDQIDLFHIALPLKTPRFLESVRIDRLETVLVRVQSGSAAGWGEASPGNAPVIRGEWAGGVFAALKHWLAPALAGREIGSGEALQEQLAPFQGNQFAKGALDMAWWDLSARMQQRPLHQVIGGYRENIELSVTLERMESLADFTEQARKAADAGFARIGMVFRPGWDLQILGCLREELPTHSLCANAGGTLRLENMETLHRLEDFNLSMVVQPLPADDLVGHAMLQEAIDTPIGLDEGIASPEQADMAIELKSCQCIDLQPGRLGGLTPAIAVHDLCQGADMPCWVGATPQSAIAARFGLAVAAKENCRFPAEHFPAEEWLETDVAASVETASIDNRRAASLWSEPGIGIEPDVNVLEANQLNHATL